MEKMTHTGEILQDLMFDIFGVEKSNIKLETSIDSLIDIEDKIIFFLRVEDYFNIDIERSKLDQIITIGDMIVTINELNQSSTII